MSAGHDERLDVSACGPAERGAQAALFNRCFKKQVEPADLVWRYDRNPHGTALSYLTRVADAGPGAGRGVCGYACSPRRVVARGDDATLSVVGETGDVMTDPDFRQRGLFSALDRAAMARAAELGWPLAFGLPNRRSAHIFLELGWERIGTVRPWTFLLRNDQAARDLRRREGRLAAWAVPLARRSCAGARLRLAATAAAAPLVLRPLERFPVEVEALSREVERGFAWMVRRDAAYLDWRFIDSPSRLHRALGLYDAAGRLAAYVVVQLPRAGEPSGWLVDLLARDEPARAAALAAALDRLEQAGASAVSASAIDGSWWSGVLSHAGFLPPKPDNHLSVIRCVHRAEHALAAASADASAWYFTDGDRDDETMG